MRHESANPGGPASGAAGARAMPAVADRATFQGELDGPRVREKARTAEGDAIAAARRRLPMVEVDAASRGPGRPGRSPWPGRSKGAGRAAPSESNDAGNRKETAP